jgi:PEP-CTERM motif
MKLAMALLVACICSMFIPVAHADGAPERFTVDTTFEVVPFDPSLPSGVETFMASYVLESVAPDEFATIGPVTYSSSGPLAPFVEDGFGSLNFTDATGAQIQIQYESIVNSWFVNLTLGTNYTEGFQMNGVPAGQPVPEPGTWALLLAGIALIGSAVILKFLHLRQPHTIAPSLD